MQRRYEETVNSNREKQEIKIGAGRNKRGGKRTKGAKHSERDKKKGREIGKITRE